MMKTHRSSRARMLGGAAFILALAGAGFAVGTPGLAQSQPDAPRQEQAQPRNERQEQRHVIIRTEEDDAPDPELRQHRGHRAHGEHERVIIMSHRGDGHGAGEHAAHGGHAAHADHGDHRVRTFTLHRGDGGHGAAAHHDDLSDCAEGQRSEVSEGEGNERTRVILCGRGGNATPAERAERLQGIRDRLAGDSELSAEQKARVTAALDREIARLRGQ